MNHYRYTRWGLPEIHSPKNCAWATLSKPCAMQPLNHSMVDRTMPLLNSTTALKK